MRSAALKFWAVQFTPSRQEIAPAEVGCLAMAMFKLLLTYTENRESLDRLAKNFQNGDRTPTSLLFFSAAYLNTFARQRVYSHQ